MEMESRTMRMLLQTMPKKGYFLTFTIFLVLFFSSVIIGATGPYVLVYNSFSTWECPSDTKEFDQTQCTGFDLSKDGTRWSGEIVGSGLDKLNQQLVLVATVENKNFDSQGVEKALFWSVSIAGKNEQDKEWKLISPGSDTGHKRDLTCHQHSRACSNITLAHEPFIDFKYYQFNVSLKDGVDYSFMGDVYFTFAFVNHKFTLFELWFRFTFLMMTFVVVILFAHKLRYFKWKDWTVEQKWVAVLLFALMGFNNPFFPLEILVDGWFPIFLDNVFLSSFICVLLLFWLIMFDGIRKESAQHTFLNFYLPKLILVGLIWITTLVVFIWTELHELDDPDYNTASEIGGYIFFQAVRIGLFIIYLFWLVYVLVRACGDMKTIPYLGTRIKFFGAFTLAIIISVFLMIVFDWYGPTENNAAEFLSFLSLFNLYVFTLAVVYLPSSQAFTSGEGSSKGGDSIGMVRLEDDPAFNTPNEEEHERIELPPDPESGSGSSGTSSESSS